MKKILVTLFIFCTGAVPALFAQEDISPLILKKDSLFWQAYNSCDTIAFKKFFSDEVEFYHDKGGLTTGAQNLATSYRNNLCNSSGFRLRREEVSGTVKVFPLHKDGIVYGAIISGEHVFYINNPGQKEYLDGRARFTHVWLLKNDSWQMSRVLSYDHGPAIKK